MHWTVHKPRIITTGPNVVEVEARDWPAWVGELLRGGLTAAPIVADGLEIRAEHLLDAQVVEQQCVVHCRFILTEHGHQMLKNFLDGR